MVLTIFWVVGGDWGWLHVLVKPTDHSIWLTTSIFGDTLRVSSG